MEQYVTTEWHNKKSKTFLLLSALKSRDKTTGPQCMEQVRQEKDDLEL